MSDEDIIEVMREVCFPFLDNRSRVETEEIVIRFVRALLAKHDAEFVTNAHRSAALIVTELLAAVPLKDTLTVGASGHAYISYFKELIAFKTNADIEGTSVPGDALELKESTKEGLG